MGSTENAVKFINNNSDDKTFVICFEGEDKFYTAKTIPYGEKSKPEQLAAHLFSALRKADDEGAKKIYVRAGSTEGVGLAVYNRLLRATGFHIIDTDRD